MAMVRVTATTVTTEVVPVGSAAATDLREEVASSVVDHTPVGEKGDLTPSLR